MMAADSGFEPIPALFDSCKHMSKQAVTLPANTHPPNPLFKLRTNFGNFWMWRLRCDYAVTLSHQQFYSPCKAFYPNALQHWIRLNTDIIILHCDNSAICQCHVVHQLSRIDIEPKWAHPSKRKPALTNHPLSGSLCQLSNSITVGNPIALHTLSVSPHTSCLTLTKLWQHTHHPHTHLNIYIQVYTVHIYTHKLLWYFC